MQSLGILIDNEQSEIELMQLFKELKFQLLTIKEKTSFNQLNGAVIYLTKENCLAKIIDWLLFSKLNPEMFVWIVYKEPLKHEQDILLELGANDVLTTSNELAKLPFIVKNTFSRTRRTDDDIETSVRKNSFLNEENQTVWINTQEKSLTKTEFRLLKILYERLNTTVSYNDIFKEIWKDDCKNKLFRVSNVVFHLRKKVNDSDQFEIKTTRSKGYMLKEKNE
ncbi:winged helix-turn-helix domain-containing protein [Enterococcus sp. LJL99]